MSYNKKNEFNTNEIEISEFAKALSHPARVAILLTLAKKNKCICGEIVDVLPLAQSTVSQHLKELKKAGLISGEIEGPRSCYCINIEKFQRASEIFKGLIDQIQINEKINCCE